MGDRDVAVESLIDHLAREVMGIAARFVLEAVAEALDGDVPSYPRHEPADCPSRAPGDGPSPTEIERLRRVLLTMVQHEPTVGEAALQLGMSRRSLQRKLQDHGTSFMSLVEDTKRDVAIGYLMQYKSAAEVALLLGFRNATSFHRAFKRWTGTTPLDYRRKMSDKKQG
jgi:AraC-like DNA-binding protein